MTDFQILLCIFAYFAIGLFFAGLLCGLDDDHWFGAILMLWPALMTMAGIFIIALAPFKLGLWIRDRFNIDI